MPWAFAKRVPHPETMPSHTAESPPRPFSFSRRTTARADHHHVERFRPIAVSSRRTARTASRKHRCGSNAHRAGESGTDEPPAREIPFYTLHPFVPFNNLNRRVETRHAINGETIAGSSPSDASSNGSDSIGASPIIQAVQYPAYFKYGNLGIRQCLIQGEETGRRHERCPAEVIHSRSGAGELQQSGERPVPFRALVRPKDQLARS